MPTLVVGHGGALVPVAAGAVLSIPAEQIGKVFKSWPWDSDSIGDTLLDLARARPDLFAAVPKPITRTRYGTEVNPETGVAAVTLNTYGPADAAMRRYRVERRGAPGKDGRIDVVVDQGGAIVYGGQTYNYDPAGDTLKTAAIFAAPALLAGGLHLAGLIEIGGGAAAAGAAGAAGVSEGAASAIAAMQAEGAAAAAALEASVTADLVASQAAALASVGSGASFDAILAAALAPLPATAGAAAAAGAAVGASSSSSILQSLAGALQSSATSAAGTALTAKLTQLLAGGGQAGGGATLQPMVQAQAAGQAAGNQWVLVGAVVALAAAVFAFA